MRRPRTSASARAWHREDIARGVAVALVVAALVDAAIDHGGFFRPGFRVVVLLLLAAVAISFSSRAAGAHDLSAPVAALGALALWYLVAAGAAHDIGSAVPSVAMLGALAATFVVARRASRREREILLGAVILVGLVVAVTGWVGFVGRRTPLALPDQCCGGVWRAASTITYANAAAATISMSLLVAFSLLATTTRPRLVRLVCFALLLGLLATLSRGGMIGLVVGLATLAAVGERVSFVRGWQVGVGGAVAGAALLPSLHLSQGRHVALACVGALVGAAISVSSARQALIAVVSSAALVAAVPAVRTPMLDGFAAVAHGRVTASSPDRTRALDDAWHLAGTHLFAGVGPGHVDLMWHEATPFGTVQLHLPYVHDEYVQVLVETGLPGFALLVAGLAATARAVIRRRRAPDVIAAAGGCAALAAVAVQSAFDFLWHVPIVPLIGTVLAAIALTGTPPVEARPSSPALDAAVA
jgi:hypothetical protein